MSDAAPPPKIEYPVLYTFRVVCRKADGMREHVRQLAEAALGPLPDESIAVRPSAKGNYVAVHVTCLLRDEEQRKAVYFKLHGDPQIVLVL